MKKLFESKWGKQLSMLLTGMFIQLITIAQDSSNISNQNNTWYNETWIWVAGAAVSILVVISLIKRGSTKSHQK
ncbi:MAG TPA: hypothetical protein VLR49_16420 [Ferruginibacter sp.]|nr:hypothetical protein [Ferruginibacter sp.]